MRCGRWQRGLGFGVKVRPLRKLFPKALLLPIRVFARGILELKCVGQLFYLIDQTLVHNGVFFPRRMKGCERNSVSLFNISRWDLGPF